MRSLRLLCVLFALLLLPYPAGASSSNVPSSMSVALVSPSDVPLYPLLITDRDMLSMLNVVYESMFILGDDREPVQSLVTEWTTLAGGKTWIFTIREGVKFHDGNDLTAYDIAATMDAIKIIAEDPGLADNQRGMYANLINVCSSWTVDADKPYQITIQTNRPCYGLLYALTFPILQAQATLEQNPPGSGPYRVEYYMPGEELYLVANSYWYGVMPQVTEIVGVFYDTIERALVDFESEDVDIIMTRSTSAVRYRGTASTRASSYDYATRQLECLMINYTGPLKDLEMRQAISYALNKSRLATNVFQSMVTPTNTLQSPSSWLYNETTVAEDYVYNPDKANELLDALGWENKNEDGYRFRKKENGETEVLELRLYYYEEAGSGLRGEASNEIALMLRSVGIRTKVTTYSFENGSQKLQSGDFDLFMCAYNFDVVPDPNFILLSNGYGNYARYRSEDMTALCKKLRTSYEAEAFQSTWMEIQALMAQDVPFIPLFWRNGVLLARYPYTNVRDIREFELLRSINEYR